MRAADAPLTELLGSAEDWFDDPAWSPDGRQIVFTQISPIENEACTMDCLPFTVLKLLELETGEILPLTDGTQWVGAPAWRP